MKWVVGIGYLLSFIALWFGATTFIRITFMIPRIPSDSDLLTGIGWLLIALFFLLLITSLKTGEENNWSDKP